MNNFAINYYTIGDDGYVDGTSLCFNATTTIEIEDDFTAYYNVLEIQKSLNAFSIIDFSDGWIIFCILCTNIISSIFICIGLIMYGKVKGFKNIHTYVWIFYFILLNCVLILSFRAYLYYDRCLSNKPFIWNINDSEIEYKKWLNGYFISWWLLLRCWNFMIFNNDIKLFCGLSKIIINKICCNKPYIAMLFSIILTCCSLPFFMDFINRCCDFTGDLTLKEPLIYALIIPQIIQFIFSPLFIHILLVSISTGFEIFVTETFRK